MKSLLFISALFFIFCAAASAQTNEISPCPTIDVKGPAEEFFQGKSATFTASLSEEAQKLNLKYQWTIVGGEIIEGQKTLLVKAIQNRGDESAYLTLTFEITGLPEECSKTYSMTVATAPVCGIELQKVDEFSIIAPRIHKARLDQFALRLQDYPNSQAYVIEKYERKTSQKAVEQKNQKIVEYLKSKGIEQNRIILLNDLSFGDFTELILVPPGAPPPECDGCTRIENP